MNIERILATVGLIAVTSASACGFAAVWPRTWLPVSHVPPGAGEMDERGGVLDSLRASAEAEQTSAVARTDLPTPNGLDSARFAAIPETGPEAEKARVTLDDAVVLLSAVRAVEPAPVKERPHPAVVAKAMRLYSQGKIKLATGDSAGAASDFEQAAKLDSASPEVWRELAEAQMAQGRRLAAISSLQSSAARGSTDPRVWWQLGRDALRSRKPEQAAWLLARAASLRDNASDEAIPYLIDADLSQALLESGRLVAGIEAATRGFEVPTPFPSATRQRAELLELFRRRGEAWRDAGDAAVRLNDADLALRCYERAGDAGLMDPSAISTRVVYVLRRAGRPAAAALMILEDVESNPGPVANDTIALLRSLAGDPGLERVLPETMAGLESRAFERSTASVAVSYARAHAAVLKPDGARSVLRSALRRHPQSAAIFEDLARTYDGGAVSDPGAAAKELALIVAAHPRALILAGTLVRISLDAGAAAAAIESDTSDAGTMVRSAILTRIGRSVESARIVRERAWSAEMKFAGECVAVEALAAAGEYAAAEPIAARLIEGASRPGATFDERLLAAHAMSACQRFDDVKALLTPSDAADEASWSDGQRRDAGRLLLMSGDPSGAERLLSGVIERDPFEESTYEALLALHSPPAPTADEGKLAETVRRLRESLPTSEVIRWATAQELMRRELFTQAQASIMSLVESGVISPSVVQGLVTTLERRIATDATAAASSEALLRRLIGRFPESSALRVALVKVLVASGKPDEAERLLDERLAVRPLSELHEAREAFIRDVRKDPARAQEIALARLTPMPRTIESTVDLALTLSRGGRLEQAALALSRDLPARGMLTDEQQAKAASMLASAFEPIERAGATPKIRATVSPEAVASVLDVLSSRGGKLPPTLHQARIAIVASIEPFDDAALTRACEQAGRDFPALSSAAFAVAAQELAATNGRFSDAVRYLRRAVQASSEPSAQLLENYVRLVAEHGSLEEAMGVGDAIGGLVGMRLVMPRLLDEDETPPAGDDAIRAEFFYRVAGRCTMYRRMEIADALLRHTLSIDPAHAMASNDLGYHLLESGSDLAEAARLIETAYRLSPDNANVMDSIGWLRYVQGRIADAPDPATGQAVEGALTLLSRAAETAIGIDNATIQDHLGDALWRAGRGDEALERWRRAAGLKQQDLAEFDDVAPAVKERAWFRAMLDETRGNLETTRKKIAAAESGKEPPVKPFASERGVAPAVGAGRAGGADAGSSGGS